VRTVGRELGVRPGCNAITGRHRYDANRRARSSVVLSLRLRNQIPAKFRVAREEPRPPLLEPELLNKPGAVGVRAFPGTESMQVDVVAD
jgi:hypothetical protein